MGKREGMSGRNAKFFYVFARIMETEQHEVLHFENVIGFPEKVVLDALPSYRKLSSVVTEPDALGNSIFRKRLKLVMALKDSRAVEFFDGEVIVKLFKMVFERSRDYNYKCFFVAEAEPGMNDTELERELVGNRYTVAKMRGTLESRGRHNKFLASFKGFLTRFERANLVTRLCGSLNPGF